MFIRCRDEEGKQWEVVDEAKGVVASTTTLEAANAARRLLAEEHWDQPGVHFEAYRYD